MTQTKDVQMVGVYAYMPENDPLPKNIFEEMVGSRTSKESYWQLIAKVQRSNPLLVDLIKEYMGYSIKLREYVGDGSETWLDKDIKKLKNMHRVKQPKLKKEDLERFKKQFDDWKGRSGNTVYYANSLDDMVEWKPKDENL